MVGVDLFSIGMVHPDDASYRFTSRKAATTGMLSLRDSHLVGAILVGDTSIAPAVKKLIETDASCADLLARVSHADAIAAGLAVMA